MYNKYLYSISYFLIVIKQIRGDKMETKNQNWTKELSEIVKEAQANEEKRLQAEAEKNFEKGYSEELQKNTDHNRWANVNYKQNNEKESCIINYETIKQLAENKKQGKINEIKIDPLDSGKLSAIACKEITHAIRSRHERSIETAIATMYFIGLMEEELGGRRNEIRQEIMDEIKTGLQKPENYCLGTIIKQEVEKYLK
jgi:predicted secreted protein